MTLLVEYDEDIYKKEKENLKGKYKNSHGYRKIFGMVGTSDENNSIAYLYFEDLDLGYIESKDRGNSMADFVDQHFKYNF